MGEDTDSFNRRQLAVLERVAAGAPLSELLRDIVYLVEGQAEGMMCSILLLDATQRLRNGVAPSVPIQFQRAIEGEAIGPTAGSCGAAAFLARRVIVSDIATHPNWTHYSQFALPQGLRACWSTPICSPDGSVLGTFAMYYREVRSPSEAEIRWVDVASHLASIAILRDRSEEALRQSEARAHQLARLYAMSSAVNEGIARVRDPQQLYEFACRMAVEKGLARLAWVGLHDAGQQAFIPVARFGADSQVLEYIQLNVANERINRGVAGQVLTTGSPAVINDLHNEPNAAWRARGIASGMRSCAAFPLIVNGAVFGVFAIYADREHYFQAEELRILTALSVDIAFAIESAGKEAERRRMEEAAHAGEHLLAMIFGTVEDAILYLSVEGPRRFRIVAANRALLRLTRLQEPAVVGRLLDEAAGDAARPLELDKYEQARVSGKRVTWEETHHWSAGTRYSQITIRPILDEDGRCSNMVCTVHDITALKNAEAERVRLEGQLHQARRLQSLGTMAGGIAHDFNNIIAAISSNVDFALLDGPVRTQAHEHLREVQKAASRAKNLVRQILTFSRREPPARELFDPLPTVEEALLLLRATLPQNVRLQTGLASTIPTVCGDPTQLHQVVMNLGTNAARAIGERAGVIEVTLSGIELVDGTPRLEKLQAGNYVRLCVRDNGCGMDAATLQCAFDPFFTTRSLGEGTGLGLAVVHGIVEGHGGAVDVDSEPGKGTSFAVYLPAYAPATPIKVMSDAASAQGTTVLYVDDDEALVFLATRALTRLGYHVVGYLDPSAAVQDFRTHPDDFDVVITDVSMPQLSGSEFAAELLQIRPNIPIIMMTGYIRPEDQEAARRLRINEVVRKPSTLEEFAQMLALCMENPQSQRM